MESKREAFAVWLTGLPASGKSAIAAALRRQLAAEGINVCVLESDVLRPILTPEAAYRDADRDRFYRQLADLGAILARQGANVIFDATANLRRYRDRARAEIPRFVEVYVECPLATCEARDPKGIYRKSREGLAANVPGVQAPYEPPAAPPTTDSLQPGPAAGALVVHGDRETPDQAAGRIVSRLREEGFLTR